MTRTLGNRLVPFGIAALLTALVGLGRLDAATFTVDSTGDIGDAHPDDGLCATSVGSCTLRAAIDEANALRGTDQVNVPAGTYLTSRPLAIVDDVTIKGDGATTTVIDGQLSHSIFGIDRATVVIMDLTVQRGFDFNAVGGIENRGTLALTRVEVTGNEVGNAAAGIENTGILTMVDSTISNNSAGNACGGLDNTGTATLTNVTISGNTVGNAGAGICLSQGGALTLNSCTITANVEGNLGAGAGLDIEDVGSTATIRNTLISGNIGSDCSGSVEARGKNIIGSANLNNCGVITSGTVIVTTEPGLGPLAYNGGQTRNHLLLTSSPAINAGDPAAPGSGGDACPAQDQRGVPRPQGAACDIGAVEGTEGTSVTAPCPTANTFASINCQLMVLVERVNASRELGELKGTLQKQVKTAMAREERAESECESGETRRAKAALRQARRFVASFQARIGSRDGRFVIRPEVREALLAAAHPIRVGLKGLRRALSCPADAT